MPGRLTPQQFERIRAVNLISREYGHLGGRTLTRRRVEIREAIHQLANVGEGGEWAAACYAWAQLIDTSDPLYALHHGFTFMPYVA